ncbi:branched-chain amino acid transport system ATP-binding protein [Desulfatibacillum alkenivorans DSM 16219]|jgi:branched-chain amino acid transport system ATP-binding protein|uniref:Branched-chain amino acid transport system ATP-binding protein n=1 Tax=Desulfatibacillum alkenivorans DSM 16219 TaxID=1121393 RepID=A0A1M6GFX1_9BACT|nr:ABC transporter ATP-binding protein [Desulfatibacillum alkenivorans]SHJ08781.1 branched-chain amino acid transport system ATP-binding protein [Desulfatibacillum alkenivorans DSM 16219]
MIIKAEKLTKKFGGLVAVDQVDFTLAAGEFKSIIGPNGAGKTTLFNLIAGAEPVDGGRILFQGDEITNLPQERIARMGVVKTCQTSQFFPSLSVMQNLSVAAQPPSSWRSLWRGKGLAQKTLRQAKAVLKQVGLESAADCPAEALSHGERRYLDLGLALAANPKVLLLDEPTAGMSPAETRQAARLIKHLAQEFSLSVILVEHDMGVVMEVSDRVLVMNEGRIFAEGAPQEIRRNPDVQRIYLGKGRAAC